MAYRVEFAVTLVSLIIFNAPFSQGVAGKDRIAGGKDAAANSAPFMVSLQQITSKGNVHYCGGTIINGNWVVTAAHCLTSSAVVYNSVMIAGSISVSGTGNTVQKRNIDYYVAHDLYVGGTAPYDIGLVYTKASFTFNSAVGPASLPKAAAIPSGTASIYGWGSTSTTSTAKYPSKLQVVSSVPIVTLQQCENALGPLSVNLHDTNVCTGPLNGGIGVCTSDSGGPLIQSKVLIGIISWGKMPCGQVNSPSVYVRVSAFNSWITQHQVAPKI